jgi:transposase InsO family protein
MVSTKKLCIIGEGQMTVNTTVAQKAARRKLNLLELANELGDVSEACRRIGYSRGQFHEIRRSYQTFGAEGLLDRIPGPRNPRPSRAAEEEEQAVLDHRLENPTRGSLKVSQQLLLKGPRIGQGIVKGVFQRRNSLKRRQRLLCLEQHCKERHIELTEHHIKLLEKFDPEFRERHIKADFSGELAAIDTFMAGNLKGMGKIHLQTVVDCHSRLAFGHLYTSKMPITSVHVFNNKVLPFFEERNRDIVAVLTGNGRECCGRPDRHPFELFLQLEEIERRTTPVRRPQSNGIVERLHRTILDEHFRIQGRIKLYESPGETQQDLDAYLHLYNCERARQGRDMSGRTPRTVFVEDIPNLENEEVQAV